jgi:uncharacterized HAD superfamily protein
MNKPKVTKIWLDMDGVIADFVKRYKQLYNIHPSEAERENKFDDLFQNFVATKQFATLDLMPHASELIKFLKELKIPTEILSSTGTKQNYDEISRQKIIWLDRNNIPFKHTFVPGKEHKYRYATPTDILIDDTEVNIDDWKKAGGIAIWHKNVEDTLAILRMYV